MDRGGAEAAELGRMEALKTRGDRRCGMGNSTTTARDADEESGGDSPRMEMAQWRRASRRRLQPGGGDGEQRGRGTATGGEGASGERSARARSEGAE
ncbi:hypothetical protein Aduo_008894 [Ancylostoma duodenale]